MADASRRPGRAVRSRLPRGVFVAIIIIIIVVSISIAAVVGGGRAAIVVAWIFGTFGIIAAGAAVEVIVETVAPAAVGAAVGAVQGILDDGLHFTSWYSTRAAVADPRILRARLASGAVALAMRLASRLMPPTAGRRWLAEADNFLFEAAPEQRAAATRNYLLTAPHVIVISWAQRARQGNASR